MFDASSAPAGRAVAQSLPELYRVNARLARLVELHIQDGLPLHLAAERAGIALRSAARAVRYACAWLLVPAGQRAVDPAAIRVQRAAFDGLVEQGGRECDARLSALDDRDPELADQLRGLLAADRLGTTS